MKDNAVGNLRRRDTFKYAIVGEGVIIGLITGALISVFRLMLMGADVLRDRMVEYAEGGAARAAHMRFGAIWGQGVGLQGRSYAIPTMHGGVDVIQPYVDEFISFAQSHPDLKFLVTRIGCGIAGFTAADIAPLFANAIDQENIILPEDFVRLLEQNAI